MNKMVILFCLVLSGFLATGQESKYKALFTYKFSEYITWPTDTDQVVVGVVGESSIYAELSKLASVKSNFTSKKVNSASEVADCNIIFITKSGSKKLAAFKAALGTKAILVISERKDHAGKGADIGFYLEGGKLRFLIDESAIRTKKMIPSSKLLALGKKI